MISRNMGLYVCFTFKERGVIQLTSHRYGVLRQWDSI